MRKLFAVCLVLLTPGLLLAQTSAPKTESDTNSDVARDLKAMRDVLAEQQKQIAAQQQEIEALRQQLGTQQAASTQTGNAAPRATYANYNASSGQPGARTVSQGTTPEKPKSSSSPLSFSIGDAQFTPGGFADFSTVFRSTNTGNSVATSFNAIPYSNTIQGHLTETRLTAQGSRLSLKAAGKFGENDVTGYFETDFLGNDAANVFVSTNPHTLRLRLAWMDVKRGRWEFLGGQAWGWLTPNRKGLSSVPSDMAITLNADHNYNVGLTFSRAAQARVVFHPNDHWALGIGIENPDQYVGAGEVIYPFAFNAQLGPQFDAANQTTVPNMHPDIISKVAYDTTWMGRAFHVEAAGLLTTVKVTNIPVGGTTFTSHTSTGGGISLATNVEIIKNVRFVGNTFWSDGGGRYLGGLGPDAVVRPVPGVLPVTFDIRPSLVKAGSVLMGIEGQVTPKTMLAGYFGADFFGRNAFPDITSPLLVKPFIGFGGPNSPNSANRALQEGTIDWIQTFWKTPNWGALQLITQYSYVSRSPWFVALGAPKNAHVSMGFVTLRYVLP